jgi:hypothetical protein
MHIGNFLMVPALVPNIMVDLVPLCRGSELGARESCEGM